MRSVAVDRLFLLFDVERYRTITKVDIKNKTIKSVILIRIETFFMGNIPVNLCPAAASTLAEKQSMGTAFLSSLAVLAA